ALNRGAVVGSRACAGGTTSVVALSSFGAASSSAFRQRAETESRFFTRHATRWPPPDARDPPSQERSMSSSQAVLILSLVSNVSPTCFRHSDERSSMCCSRHPWIHPPAPGTCAHHRWVSFRHGGSSSRTYAPRA